MRESANKILQKTDIDKLPSLPQSLLALLELCTSESVPYDRLARLLRHDPALHLRVSAAMQHNGIDSDDSATSLMDSLSRLDSNRLRSIATNASTMQFFSRVNRERTEFLKAHWRHSLVCAHVTEYLCSHTGYGDSELAYKAGQLHNIGQLILESAFPDTYTHTFARLGEDDNFRDLEEEQFGTTHQEIGRELLRRHGCSAFISDAALYHHEPAGALQDTHPVIKLVHIAHRLASEHFDADKDAVFEDAVMLLGLGRPLLLDALRHATTSVELIAESLEIEFPDDKADGETLKQIVSREQNKQLRLAEQVRIIALLDSLHQTISYADVIDIDAINREQCQLLFGIDSCLLFVQDEDRLRNLTTTPHAHLNEVSLPLEEGRSLSADAIIQRRLLDSSDAQSQPLSVIDKQYIDLYDGVASVHVPMLLEQEVIGVIVFVVNAMQHEHLQRQHTLLRQFAQALAHIIRSQRGGDSPASPDPGQGPDDGDNDTRLRELAHEIRNPLSIMNNYLEVLSFKLESDSPAQQEITTLKSEIDRIGNIIRNMTDRGTVQSEAADTDINRLLMDITAMMRSSMSAERNLEFVLSLDEHMARVTTNENALKQIYTNLLKNAVEALPANGKIMVYTQDNVNVDGRPHIEISIIDDGPGIPEDLLPFLFSPVDTTKAGEHAGLGLTIVKNLVNELNGSIRCRSSDRGTEFTILLPR